MDIVADKSSNSANSACIVSFIYLIFILQSSGNDSHSGQSRYQMRLKANADKGAG